MIAKIEKVLDLLTAALEKYLASEAVAPAAAAPAPARKPRVKKEGAPEAKFGAENIAALGRTIDANNGILPGAQPAAELSLEDQLGLGGEEEKKQPEEKPKALTAEEAKKRVDEVTRQFVRLYKTSKPDGMERAKALKAAKPFNGKKLEEFTYEEALAWIAAMEKGVLEAK